MGEFSHHKVVIQEAIHAMLLKSIQLLVRSAGWGYRKEIRIEQENGMYKGHLVVMAIDQVV